MKNRIETFFSKCNFRVSSIFKEVGGTEFILTVGFLFLIRARLDEKIVCRFFYYFIIIL